MEDTKYVLFLQGGGWCFTDAQCLGRSKGGIGSSKNDGPTMKDVGGIMSMLPEQNPGFAGYIKVFMRYCDGSSFSSNAVEKSPEGVWYRGRPNFNAVIDILVNSYCFCACLFCFQLTLARFKGCNSHLKTKQHIRQQTTGSGGLRKLS
jgi:hypothetical protein